jgi:predicted nuclease of predicted toxin-antitoxin system
MHFVADEGVVRPVVDQLRAEGHKVDYVAEMEPGLDDRTILRRANEASALLITADKDFGELIFRKQQVTEGVILVRLPGLSLEAKAQTVSHTVEEYASELTGAFTVVGPGTVRVRSFPS